MRAVRTPEARARQYDVWRTEPRFWTKQEMAELEKQIERLPGLDKWFVTFSPPSPSLG